MLNPTILLTLATLAGLVAGFAREWLLVADWGASARTDAFLVGMFVTEAIRTTLGGGLLSAAALPIWSALPEERRAGWLAGQIRHWLLVGTGLALVLAAVAPALVRLIGPGLGPVQSNEAAMAMRCLSLSMPGLFLQALLAVPSQAAGRFLVPGLASLLFNLPAVIYLAVRRVDAAQVPLALCFAGGSVLAALVLAPGAWAKDRRRERKVSQSLDESIEVWMRLWPLLVSSGASQGLALFERLAASLMGEGSITLVNLARKLINIPLIALMSLNQVLLGRMSGEEDGARIAVLRRGLDLCTLLTLPAAIGLVGAAPALVQLLLPAGLATGPLPALLACYSVAVVFGSWNALLARFSYAGGDTRSPLGCELLGGLLQAVLLFTLPPLIGIDGLAGAAVGGVMATGILLTLKLQPERLVRLLAEQAGIVLLLSAVGVTLFRSGSHGPWVQLGAAVAVAAAALLVMAMRLRRVSLTTPAPGPRPVR